MELQDVIRNRRSIRKYRNKEVSDGVLMKVLEAGVWAPFASQRWILITVREHETKSTMLDRFYAEGRNLHVLNAPVDIIVCCDFRDKDWPKLQRKNHGKEDFKQLFSVQETAAMIQNMLLTAHELGLGACWNGSFDEKHVASALKIPNGIRPVAIISLGYPDEEPTPPKRKNLEKILYSERFC